jgi:hypothetical protein
VLLVFPDAVTFSRKQCEDFKPEILLQQAHYDDTVRSKRHELMLMNNEKLFLARNPPPARELLLLRTCVYTE